MDREILQQRIKTYKQLEVDIKSFQDEMSSLFKKQHADVSRYEADNKQLSQEISFLDTQIQK